MIDLKTVPEKKDKTKTAEEALELCLERLTKIKGDYDELETQDAEAQSYYRRGKLGNEVKGRSQVVTSAVHDTIEGAMPTLMRYVMSDDTTKLAPTGGEDVAGSDLMQELVKYQLRVKNNWYNTSYDATRDTLLLRRGIFGWGWEKKVTRYEKEYTDLTPDQVMGLALKKNVKEVMIGEDQTTATVTFEDVDEFPFVRAINPEDALFLRNTRSKEKLSFFAERTRFQKWEMTREFGEQDTDDLESTSSSTNPSMLNEERFADLGGTGFFFDETSKEYIVYKCYYPDPETGVQMEHFICGTKSLRYGKNKYGEIPYEVAAAFREPHRMIGRSYYDEAKHWQKITSALLRGLLDNIYFNNSGRFMGSKDRIDMDALLNRNVPGGFVDNGGDPNNLQPMPMSQLQPWTFTLLEYIAGQQEMATGITRQNQGIQASSLNKTKGGMQMLMGASQQKLEMVVRTLAETGIAPVIRAFVKMNLMFLKDSIIIRVLNKPLQISPENIAGEYDVSVNVGLGTGDREEKVVQYQQLLALYKTMFEAKIPVVTAQNVYNAVKGLLIAMERKDFDQYITDPGFVENVGALTGAVGQLLPGLAQVAPQIAQQIGPMVEKLQASLGMPAVPQGGPQPMGIEQSPNALRQPMNPNLPAMAGLAGGQGGGENQ